MPYNQSYSYDEGNRLQSLSSPAGVFGYSYNVGQSVSPASLVRRLTFPNGAYITNAFDSVARLTGTWLKNSGGTILNSHAYGYNLAGLRTALTNIAGNYVNYTYDNVGQLKTASGKESGGTSRLHEQLGGQPLQRQHICAGWLYGDQRQQHLHCHCAGQLQSQGYQLGDGKSTGHGWLRL